MSEIKDNGNAFAESIMGLTKALNASRKGEFERPGRTIVGMNEGKLVEASDSNTEIFTFGVSECNAVAIDGVCNDRRFGVLTHYDPLNIQNNLLKITQLGEQINSSGKPEEVEAELFVRGDWEKVDGKWEMKPKSQSEVERLTQSVKKSFGESISVKVSPYSENIDMSKKEQGQVAVNLTPTAGKRILGIF